MSTIYDFQVNTIDGNQQSLEDFKGQTCLVVNVASECGLTPQYEALEALYQSKQQQNFTILGFPCNQFGGQEPGNEQDIKSFCTTHFNVTFPLFAKIEVNGANQHPLYQWLLHSGPNRVAPAGSDFVEQMKNYGIEANDDEILWNFEKFLIDPDGKIVGHFSPDTKPDDDILLSAIEQTSQG